MKNIFLILLTLLVSSTLYAEGGDCHGKQKGSEKHINRLSDSLGLNQAQVAELELIFDDAHTNCESAGREGMRECMRGQKDEIDQQVSSILDVEQQLAFSQLQEERRNKGRRGSRPSGDR